MKIVISALLNLGMVIVVKADELTCLDNPFFKYGDDKDLTCQKIRNDETKRQRYCQETEVRQYCSQTCGDCCDDNRKCCVDDPDFSFKLNGKDRNCKWLAVQNSEQQKQLCPLLEKGMVVENSCIETCGLCIAGEPLTVTPSMSPSTSISPTVSSKPTQAPSKSTEPTSEETSSWPTTSIPSTSSSPTVTHTGKRKPNILLILADDVGVGDIKGYWNDSHSQVHMPHMKYLVKNGTTFFNAHSTPLCATSRYVLLSGNYQHRGRLNGGVWKLGSYGQFKEKQMSIAEVLKTQGNYHTAVMGKWHIGGRIQPNGLQGDHATMLSNNEHNFELPIKQGAKSLGFDSSLISMSGIQGTPYTFFRNDYLDTKSIKYWELGSYDMPFGKSKIIKPGEGAQDWDSTAYNMILVNETNRFLDEHMEKRPNDPFFAYVALGAAHIPHTPPNFFLNGDPIANQYKTVHMDMLSEIDMALGALTKGLEDRGLLENTIIIFASDNGGLSPKKTGSDKYNHHSSSELRGYKGSPYEGGHRVPFIMRYDGVIPAGENEDSLIGLNDVFATLCDMVDIQVPSGQAHDSMSFADLIMPDSLNHDRRRSLGIWRMLKLNYGADFEFEALMTTQFKLIHYANATVELYDLKNDLGEKVDLSSYPFHKKRIKSMKKILSKIGP